MMDFSVASMTQSLASVSSFVRDMSWDDLAAAASPGDRTLTQDDAFFRDEPEHMMTEIDSLLAPAASVNAGGRGGRRLEVPPTVGLNRTYNADDLKANLDRTFDANRTGLRTAALDRAGPLDRTGPLDLTGPLDSTGLIDRTGPLDRMGPPDRTGPLDCKAPQDLSGPLDCTVSMGNTRPLDSPETLDRTLPIDRPGLLDRLRPLNRTFRMRDRFSSGERSEKILGKLQIFYKFDCVYLMSYFNLKSTFSAVFSVPKRKFHKITGKTFIEADRRAEKQLSEKSEIAARFCSDSTGGSIRFCPDSSSGPVRFCLDSEKLEQIGKPWR